MTTKRSTRVQDLTAGTTVEHPCGELVIASIVKRGDRFRVEFTDGTFRNVSWGALFYVVA